MLSGLAILVSGAWLAPNRSFDITMLSQVLRNHFSFVGPIVLLFTVILFAFTSIIGNGYNGSQCFLFATKNKWIRWYYALIAIFSHSQSTDPTITCAEIEHQAISLLPRDTGIVFVVEP